MIVVMRECRENMMNLLVTWSSACPLMHILLVSSTDSRYSVLTPWENFPAISYLVVQIIEMLPLIFLFLLNHEFIESIELLLVDAQV